MALGGNLDQISAERSWAGAQGRTAAEAPLDSSQPSSVVGGTGPDNRGRSARIASASYQTAGRAGAPPGSACLAARAHDVIVKMGATHHSDHRSSRRSADCHSGRRSDAAQRAQRALAAGPGH
jgi:hypothetical protein